MTTEIQLYAYHIDGRRALGPICDLILNPLTLCQCLEAGVLQALVVSMPR
jgi:hypothetical protein